MTTRRNKSKNTDKQSQVQAVENSTVENSTVENSAVENSTVENSTVENSAVENSTVDNSTSENSDLHVIESTPICAYYSQNGKTLEYETGLLYKKTVTDEVMTEATTRAIAIRDAYKAISDGYYKLLPELAKAYFAETWSNFENIKNTSQFLITITGCSSSTASEMVKVASTLYNSNGDIITGYEIFNYSDMIQLAKLDPVIRKEVRDKAETLILSGEKYNRTVLRNLVRDACIQHLTLAPKKFREEYDKEQRRIPKAEQAKAEQAKAEQPKAEQAKAEQPKAEHPKAEQPKAEQPKAEQAKAEQPSAEQSEFSTDEYGVNSENPFDSGLAKTLASLYDEIECSVYKASEIIEIEIKPGLEAKALGEAMAKAGDEKIARAFIHMYNAYASAINGINYIDENYK